MYNAPPHLLSLKDSHAITFRNRIRSKIAATLRLTFRPRYPQWTHRADALLLEVPPPLLPSLSIFPLKDYGGGLSASLPTQESWSVDI